MGTYISTIQHEDNFEDAESIVGPDGRNYVHIEGSMSPVDHMCCCAFHGLVPYSGAVVVHIDDDVSNDNATNLTWSTPLKRSKSPADRVQADWHLFYWSQTQLHGGKTLVECADTYGVGGWIKKSENMIAAVVFLDETRSVANSFLLGIKPCTKYHSHAKSSSYDADDTVLKISPRHGIGARLQAKLADATFEVIEA